MDAVRRVAQRSGLFDRLTGAADEVLVLIAFFTILVNFSSTLLTAWWASRFDPVEALRYE